MTADSLMCGDAASYSANFASRKVQVHAQVAVHLMRARAAAWLQSFLQDYRSMVQTPSASAATEKNFFNPFPSLSHRDQARTTANHNDRQPR
jgi:uncharacterized protein YchJ